MLVVSSNISTLHNQIETVLAQVSGARLLFTNDRDLQRDFGDRRIIGGTRGRIYTTIERTDFRTAHRNLLKRADLCER